jgi:hypothetical protein
VGGGGDVLRTFGRNAMLTFKELKERLDKLNKDELEHIARVSVACSDTRYFVYDLDIIAGMEGEDSAFPMIVADGY